MNLDNNHWRYSKLAMWGGVHERRRKLRPRQRRGQGRLDPYIIGALKRQQFIPGDVLVYSLRFMIVIQFMIVIPVIWETMTMPAGRLRSKKFNACRSSLWPPA